MAKMIDEAMAAFLRGRSAVAHLVDSFDRFCEDVPRLFRETEGFSVEKEGCKASIKLLDGCLRPPEVTAPWKARLGDESYAARMYATIEIQLTNPKKIDESFRFNDVFIGEIPCMIGSRLSDANVNAKTDCLFDPGAYFIIDGAEKAIVPQESHSLSRCSISHRDGGIWKAYVGYPSKGLSFRKLITTVTIDNGEIELGVPGADRVPVVVAFRALGLSTDKNILEVVGGAANDPELADLLLPSLRSAAKEIKKFQDDRDVDHRDAAVNLEFLATTKRRLEGDYLDSLFPVLASGRSKAIYLGYVVELLCSARLGRRQIQKNSLTDRRIVGVGELFAMMLTKAMNRFMRETCKRVLLSKTITEDVFSSGIVTSDFRNGFKGGPWADPKAYATGVVEALKRHNVSCALSHLRRVRAPSLYSGKVTDSRYPNKSHTGRFCPVETPDGEHCGHLKALALFATISARRDEGPVIEKLVEHMEEIEDVSLEELHGFVKVFLNGRLLGFAGNGPEVAFQLRKFRREGEIHPEVEVVLNNHGELHVFTDGGRILRPLFIVEGNQCLLPDEKLSELIRLSNDKKIDFLLREGAVEFIGPEEEERCLIASRLKDLRTAGENIAYTHLEIHPGSILSFAASTIPFSDHNLSTRVTYQAQKHSKQAIGYYSCNPSKRFDTTSDQLFYPQKQIISTRMCHFLSGSDPARAGWPEKMMHGQSCIVAVACYDGYNQEDSLIINQSAADRGLFCSTHLRTHRHTTAPDERFGRPEEEDGSPQQRYQHLESDGFPEVGARLQASHAVIGKMRKMKDGTVADSSVFLKNFEGGSVKEVAYVCSKQATQGPQGPQTVKVQIGSTRSAQVGDKFSSLHGQKGVVGACLSHEDLPFTRQGIVPDVIINPHAFPTRQTLGQMLESVAGKAAAMGQKTSATPFCGHSPEQVAAALHKSGFQKFGNEKFYNGFYGSMMRAEIFVGICFYQKLMHMVDDKIKWRRIGRHDSITRQPIGDRQKYGGIKFSQMERCSLVAHGAAASIQERMFRLSDPHAVDVCTRCDRMASIGRTRMPYCRFCRDEFPSFVSVAIPYSCKLLVQELNSMGIDLRLMTDSSASLRPKQGLA